MPILLLFSQGGGGPPVLKFVDSTGVNPLPPGIIVTLSASGTIVGTGMMQAGGIAPISFTNGTYTASFVGTQAPSAPVKFSTRGSKTEIVVPNYQSPAHSAQGYAIEAASMLAKGWFVSVGN